jgi:hypothetical protein
MESSSSKSELKTTIEKITRNNFFDTVRYKNPRKFQDFSLYKTSIYPRVYLSSNLEQKIKEVRLMQNLLDSPQRKVHRKRHMAIKEKVSKEPKLYILVSSTPNYILKLSQEPRCCCCNKRSLSFEEGFDRVIEEKRLKTQHAKEDFDKLCHRHRPKTTNRDPNKTLTSISEGWNSQSSPGKRAFIKPRNNSVSFNNMFK